MIRQFQDDKTGSTAIDYGLIVQHHRIQKIVVFLPAHEPALEAEAAPYNAARC
jgi:hypothetical protein